MIEINKNKKGHFYQSGIGGHYPANNRDPQCDIDIDEDQYDQAEAGAIDRELDEK